MTDQEMAQARQAFAMTLTAYAVKKAGDEFKPLWADIKKWMGDFAATFSKALKPFGSWFEENRDALTMMYQHQCIRGPFNMPMQEPKPPQHDRYTVVPYSYGYIIVDAWTGYAYDATYYVASIAREDAKRLNMRGIKGSRFEYMRQFQIR